MNKSLHPKYKVYILLFMIAFCVKPTISFAHAVGADAYVMEDGKSILIESWMGANEEPKQGKITILREDGTIAVQAELQDGKYIFTPQEPQRFKFIIEIGLGHGKTFEIHEDELEKLKANFDNVKQPAKEPPPVKGKPRPIKHKEPAGMEKLLRVLIGLGVIGIIGAAGYLIQKKKNPL